MVSMEDKKMKKKLMITGLVIGYCLMLFVLFFMYSYKGKVLRREDINDFTFYTVSFLNDEIITVPCSSLEEGTDIMVELANTYGFVPDGFNYNADTGLYQFTVSDVYLKASRGIAYKAAFNRYNERLHEIVSEDATKEELLKGMIQVASENLTYDFEYTEDVAYSDKYKPVNQLLKEHGVCSMYALFIKELCERNNIECSFCSTNLNGSLAHVFNYVQVDDGSWRVLDSTNAEYLGVEATYARVDFSRFVDGYYIGTYVNGQLLRENTLLTNTTCVASNN